VTVHRTAGASRLIAVVPAYNESATVGDVVRQLASAGLDVVVIDDGSTDGTAEALAGAPCTVVRHLINRGQGAALQTGIRFALIDGADIIVTFDADGQHDAADIPALVSPIARGECDVTLGSRFLGRAADMPATRRVMLKAGILFTRVVSGVRLTDVHNGVRAFSRSAAADLRLLSDGMQHASEIVDEISRLGLRFREVPVTVRYTPASLAKGQRSWHAMKIAVQVLVRKLPT
jgi:glycosyltransferase involved in cell wall biosynthesis